MAKKKRVIVFGGSGLIGSECVALLKKRGHEVFAPSHHTLDIQDIASVEAYLARKKPQVVINAVGLLNVEAIEKDPLPAWRVNAIGAGTIACATAKIPRATLVHISTSQVFEGKKTFYSEEDDTKPLTAYGQSKMVGDSLVRHYCEIAQIKYHIVRASWLYGSKRKTFVDAVLTTLQKEGIFEAAMDQRGNPTNVIDFAEGIITNFVESNAHHSGFFYIGNKTQRKGVSRYDIALEVAKATGIPASRIKKTFVKNITTTPRPSVSLVNTKLPPLRDWRAALEEYIVTLKRE
jgi:dTDP-4-dehydrorhamnose reductase